MCKRDEEVREAVAAYAHSQWSGWMRHVFRKSTINDDGTATIPVWAVEHWQRQMNTLYADLSEEEKESDRKEADGYRNVISDLHGENEDV